MLTEIDPEPKMGSLLAEKEELLACSVTAQEWIIASSDGLSRP
jgi:hypothetical protein